MSATLSLPSNLAPADFAADVRSAVLVRIAARLGAVNGRRRTRLLSMSSAMAMLRDVTTGHAWSYCDGGSVAAAYRYPAETTLVLAARVNDRIYLGIASADAKATSPGRAWGCLQPWRHGSGPAGDAAAKWTAWTTFGGVLELAGAEVDAILKGE